MQGNPPASVLVAVAAAVLLLVASADPAAADRYRGRVVITGYAAGARGAASAHHAVMALMPRRLEDEVAPELSSRWPTGLEAGNDGHISYGALDKDKPACPNNSCAGKGGASYTRPCTYQEQCHQ